MRLKDLVERAVYPAGRNKVNRREIRAIVLDVLTNIAKMPVGESLRIQHFGTFKKVVHKERRIYVTSAPPNTVDQFSRSLRVIPSFEVLKFRAAKGPAKRRVVT